MEFAQKLFAGFVFAACAAGFGCSSQEPTREERAPVQTTLGQAARTVEVTATVVAVDTAERRVTVRSPEGQEMTFEVSPNVTGLERIQPGDTIKTTYREAIVLSLRRFGEKGTSVESTKTMAPIPEGFEAARKVNVTAEIVAVNTTNNTITFRGPQGVLRTIRVTDPDYQKRLTELRVGDKIELTYFENIAVALEPTRAPAAQL